MSELREAGLPKGRETRDVGPGPAAAVGAAGRRKAVTETDWDRGGMLPPPSHPGAPALEVWAVPRHETNPPPEAEPLDWMRLRSDGDRTPDMARRLAHCCAARWSIEEFFRLLQSGMRLQDGARRHLQPGTVVRSAGLGCFRGVQDAGYAPRPPVTGGGQGSCETPGRQGVNTLLGNTQRSPEAAFHACAAKYAERYLGVCAYRSNRRYHRTSPPARLCPRAHPAAAGPPLRVGWNL